MLELFFENSEPLTAINCFPKTASSQKFDSVLNTPLGLGVNTHLNYAFLKNLVSEIA